MSPMETRSQILDLEAYVYILLLGALVSGSLKMTQLLKCHNMLRVAREKQNPGSVGVHRTIPSG